MREPDEVLVANAAFASAVSLRAGIRPCEPEARASPLWPPPFELGISPGPRLLLCGHRLRYRGPHLVLRWGSRTTGRAGKKFAF